MTQPGKHSEDRPQHPEQWARQEVSRPARAPLPPVPAARTRVVERRPPGEAPWWERTLALLVGVIAALTVYLVSRSPETTGGVTVLVLIPLLVWWETRHQK